MKKLILLSYLFLISVVAHSQDSTSVPKLTCPPNVTVTAKNVDNESKTGLATAVPSNPKNVFDTVVYMMYADKPVEGTNTITRTWIGIDSYGNTGSCTHTITVKDTFVKPWTKGDFFAGINSQALGVSPTSVGLSPQIGYAISDDDILYLSVWYAKDPRISTFKAGWYKRAYYSGYVGLSGTIYGEKATWNKALSLELGVAKTLFNFLMITPKVMLVWDWSDANADFHFASDITFAVKLSKKQLK